MKKDLWYVNILSLAIIYVNIDKTYSVTKGIYKIECLHFPYGKKGKYITFYKNDKIHNYKKYPSVIYFDDIYPFCISYYKDGKKHSYNGKPAVIELNNNLKPFTLYYYDEGLLHRRNGKASIKKYDYVHRFKVLFFYTKGHYIQSFNKIIFLTDKDDKKKFYL